LNHTKSASSVLALLTLLLISYLKYQLVKHTVETFQTKQQLTATKYH